MITGFDNELAEIVKSETLTVKEIFCLYPSVVRVEMTTGGDNLEGLTFFRDQFKPETFKKG